MTSPYDFSALDPPALTEAMLRRELERRQAQRQTVWLAVGGVLWLACVLVLGAIVYPQWPWLSVGCIGVIAAAVVGALAVTWILTHEREECMEQ